MYAGYSRRDNVDPDEFLHEPEVDVSVPIELARLAPDTGQAAASTNSHLRTYRLVVAATSSFVQNFYPVLPQTNVQLTRRTRYSVRSVGPIVTPGTECGDSP